MKQQTDSARLDKLSQEYSTHADYCRHMAEAASPSFKGEWMQLAASWTKLAEEANQQRRPRLTPRKEGA
jgi:hypothetical protein